MLSRSESEHIKQLQMKILEALIILNWSTVHSFTKTQWLFNLNWVVVEYKHTWEDLEDTKSKFKFLVF
jgi:hypothetical protein